MVVTHSPPQQKQTEEDFMVVGSEGDLEQLASTHARAARADSRRPFERTVRSVRPARAESVRAAPPRLPAWTACAMCRNCAS